MGRTVITNPMEKGLAATNQGAKSMAAMDKDNGVDDGGANVGNTIMSSASGAMMAGQMGAMTGGFGMATAAETAAGGLAAIGGGPVLLIGGLLGALAGLSG